MLFAANIAVEQEVIVPAIMIALFIFTRLLCTPPSSVLSHNLLPTHFEAFVS